MSRVRPASASGVHPATAAQPHGGLLRAWVQFWFRPSDPLSLHVLRLATGAALLFWLLPLHGYIQEFFGLQGWFDRRAYSEAAALPGGPPSPLTWSLLYLCGSSPALLTAAFWVSAGILVAFTAGLWPRLTAILAWLVVASFTANPALTAEADVLLHMLSFYLMLGYLCLGQAENSRPLWRKLLGPATVWPIPRPQSAASVTSAARWGTNVPIRLLQVHFAFLVVMSGLHKLQSGDWWSGISLWFAIYHPLDTTLEMVRNFAASAPFYWMLLSLAGYAILAWQISFPFFAWRERCTWLLLAGGLAGGAGTALFMDSPGFGPLFLAGCLSYVRAGDWARAGHRVQKLFGLGRLSGGLAGAGAAAQPHAQRKNPHESAVGSRPHA